MKIAMTLALGDPECLEAQVAFHLNAGVDLVITPVDDAADDTSVILDPYARQGFVARAPELAGLAQPEIRGLAARLAATEHGADWLICSDAGEFWWPRGASLRDVLVAVPPRYATVQALVRDFFQQAEAGFFADRMTARSSLAQISPGPEPLLHLLRPIQRLKVGVGASVGQPLRAWYPVEVLRFPFAGSTRKGRRAVEDETIAAGLQDGTLVIDDRLRDALRALRGDAGYRLPDTGSGLSPLDFAAPTVVDDALYAVECAAVGEVDLDRLDRQIRELEDRIASLEHGFWPRVVRRTSRLAGGRFRRPR